MIVGPQFRPGFERAFPACVPHLPPPLTVKQVSARLGVTEDEYKRRCLYADRAPSDRGNAGEDTGEDIPF
jgi:hypothetical protein